MDKASADRVSVDEAGNAPAAPRRHPDPRHSWLIPAGLLLILAILTVNVLVHGPLVTLDERIRDAVLPRAHSPAWRWLSDTPHGPAPLLTDLGMTTVAVPILAAVALALAIRRHTIRPVLIALTGVALLLGTVIPAKILIARSGPGLPPVSPGALGVFPSGHTSTACVCFSLAVLMLVAGQPARTRYLALAGLGLLWLGVGAALVWCDWHWFTDVAAAWILSALLIQLTFWIYRARTPPAGRPAQPSGHPPR
ncbi:MAG: phosphatase PAP2 family protein [Streptosporangiaceae bacterium]